MSVPWLTCRKYERRPEFFPMKKRLALITWSGLPHGAESEQRMLPYFAAAGVETHFIDWRRPGVNYGEFDLLVLRSCWDYHLHGTEFTDWLRDAASTVPVLNDLETVLWNRNKFYLRELKSRGIEIAPTIFATGTEAIGAAERSQISRWRKVVVKPAVSASAHNTRLLDGAALLTDQELAQQMGGEPFLIQQFIPEIQTHGEISFVYIDGRFSHAVLKRPAAGDFRVQQEHGGSAEPFLPTPGLLEQANEIATAVPQVRESLYCRLDAIAKDGKLVLMELELIEPELYLGLAEGAAERFAGAIVGRMF
jgi:glutathione synthase/RimK-type ligase-like ATP-grasp enzyme